jgi:uncharacterized membrane protein YsdA (DUF1294 family)
MIAWQVIAAWYAALGLATAAAMAADKAAAKLGQRRIPERTLHTLELAGGWAGSLAAMFVFHHKRTKVRFWAVTCLIAAAHVTACTVALLAGWVI